MSKPTKPYPTFPLTPHVRGGWAKKYKGQLLYFASSDPDEALEEFHRRAAQIDRGEVPTPSTATEGEPTVNDLIVRYLAERQADHRAGKLTIGSLNDYADAGRELLTMVGKSIVVSDLRPDHFTELRRRLEARLGAHALARMIQNVRTIFNHGYEQAWIREKPRYGKNFSKPQPDHRAGAGFTPREILLLAATAGSTGTPLEAMILLAINGGFTQRDIAALPRSAVDLKRGLISFPRPKNIRRRRVDRIIPLWPETLEALREVMKERPDDDLVFRTIHGNPYTRTKETKNGKAGSVDSIGLLFRRLCEQCGLETTGFAWLRHAFRTLADAAKDSNATARIMGHKLPGLDATYVDSIEGARLRTVVELVRGRIFTPEHVDVPRRRPGRPRKNPAPAPVEPVGVEGGDGI